MGSPTSGGVSLAAHVVLTVDATELELAADALRQSGARAIEERHVGNAIELWAVLGDSAATTAFVDRWRDRWLGRVELVDLTPSDTWKRYSEPVTVNDKLVIVPAWMSFREKERFSFIVSIDPEESFGLGDHPTTRIVADLLCRLMAPESSVLDMGSGSGVLSIVAALLGARRVVGIDRAIGAVAVAQRNAARNSVAEVTDFRQGSTVPSGEQFDLVAANILAPVLLDLCEPIVGSVEPGGTIILSGLHIDRIEDVINRYVAEGCRLVEDRVLEGWCGVAMTKQQ
ncbi:MAG: 50S ribosomal protein L11 methyltransferase [Ilumatobacteraceae bacterium]|nr:50S ribosomal protein L11 methyltransferase [Ilumatobacteraceae bacterium]